MRAELLRLFSGDGGGDRNGCGGGCEGGLTQFVGAVGGGGHIGVVVINGVGMSVGNAGAGYRGSVVMSGGGGACAISGRAS